MDTVQVTSPRIPRWVAAAGAAVICALAALITSGAVSMAPGFSTPSEDAARQFGSAHAQVGVTHQEHSPGRGFPDPNATRIDVQKVVEQAVQRPVVMVAGDAATGAAFAGYNGSMGVLFVEDPAAVGTKVELISGRLPSAPGEILLSPELAAQNPDLSVDVAAITQSGHVVNWNVVGTGRGHFRTDPEDIVAIPTRDYTLQRADGRERWMVVGGDPLTQSFVDGIHKAHPSIHVRTRDQETLAEWVAVRVVFPGLFLAGLSVVIGALVGLFGRGLVDLPLISNPSSANAQGNIHTMAVGSSKAVARTALAVGAAGAASSALAGMATTIQLALTGERLVLGVSATVFCALMVFMGPVMALAGARFWERMLWSRTRHTPLNQRLRRTTKNAAVAFSAGFMVLAAVLGFDLKGLLSGEVRWGPGDWYEQQVAAVAIVYLVSFVAVCLKFGKRTAALVMPFGAAAGWLATTAPYFGGGLALFGMIPVHLGVGLSSLMIAAVLAVIQPHDFPGRVASDSPADPNPA